MSEPPITVRDLRRLWKPHKERLNGHDEEHPTNVRFHRACSWLQRAEQTGKDDLDLSLLSQWIAFNALYGQWNHEAREPLSDNVCWKHFLERMLDLDKGSHIVDTLMENKPLVMSIFDDQILEPLLLAGAMRQASKPVEEDQVRCQNVVHPRKLAANPRPALRANLFSSLPVGPWRIDLQQFTESHSDSTLFAGDGPPVASIPPGLDQLRVE